MDNAPVAFQDKAIRRLWHEGEWFFSIVDIVQALTDSPNPRQYWGKLKDREFIALQLSPIWVQLRLHAEDGKLRFTDCVNMKNAFRLIQSIPSKKAEPFKQWLAQVGYERIEEIKNPELGQQRIREIYRAKGYSDSWIDKRLRGITVRQDLTDEWKKRGVQKENEFSILTAEITKATFGMTPTEYMKFKGLTRENLRDHMRELELIFTMLGEASTAELERVKDPFEFTEHKKVSKEGGTVAKKARVELEKRTRKPVMCPENYLDVPEKSKLLEHK